MLPFPLRAGGVFGLAVRSLLGAACFAGQAVGAEPPEGLPEGVVGFGGHWYLAVEADLSPAESAAACAGGGGYLAVVNSKEEHRFLKGLLGAKPETRYWVGGKREEGAWVWSDGSPMRGGSVAFVANNGGQDPLFVALRTAANQRDLAGLDPADGLYPVGGYVTEWGDSQVFEAADGGADGGAAGASVQVLAGERRIGCVLGRRVDGEPVLAEIVAEAEVRQPGQGFELVVEGGAGELMRNAVNEVRKLLQLRFGSGLLGKISIRCEGDGAKLDIGSSLAWAVLADALITGEPLDGGVVLFGDLNADGKTRPAGASILRLASLRGESLRVGIPAADRLAPLDLVVAGYPEVVSSNAVVGLEDFDAACAFARPAAGGAVAASRQAFGEMQKLYRERGGQFASLLKHAAVRGKLKAVIEGQPAHLSARTLLAAGGGTLPETISLAGSRFFILHRGSDILDAVPEGEPLSTQIRGEQMADSISAIRRVRLQLDRKTHRLADAVIELGDLLRVWADNRPNTQKVRNEHVDKVNTVLATIRRELDLFQTELMELR